MCECACARGRACACVCVDRSRVGFTLSFNPWSDTGGRDPLAPSFGVFKGWCCNSCTISMYALRNTCVLLTWAHAITSIHLPYCKVAHFICTPLIQVLSPTQEHYLERLYLLSHMGQSEGFYHGLRCPLWQGFGRVEPVLRLLMRFVKLMHLKSERGGERCGKRERRGGDPWGWALLPHQVKTNSK